MGARKPKAARRRTRPTPHHAATEAPTDAHTPIYAAIHTALNAYHDSRDRSFERALDALTTAPDDLIDASLEEITAHVLGELWERGWQPLDLSRAVPADAPIDWLGDQIAGQHSAYPADLIHDRWGAQVRAVRADERSNTGSAPARSEALRAILEVIATISYLPDLPLLMPPPGRARRGTLAPDARAADSRMLARIRALLAKAESTTFAAEAEAYSAKAQELMARHTIDHALLAAADEDPDKPMGVRITIDRPYAEAKALLLQYIAGANMCRAAWSPEFGFSTVFGHPPDLDVVEMMFVSLLVQGAAAMVREGSATAVSPARTREFRQSFMQAYASRLGERLRSISTGTRSEASAHDDRLLPALASREKAVEERMRQMFPTSSRGTVRIRNERGWRSGRAAADQAALHPSS